MNARAHYNRLMDGKLRIFWLVCLGMLALAGCGKSATLPPANATADLASAHASQTASMGDKQAQAARLTGVPSATSVPTSTPQPTVAALTPGPGEIVAADNGKTFTIGLTWRIALVLREDQYPAKDLTVTCTPGPVLGGISNVESAPAGYVVRRYEGVDLGQCVLRNGDFSVTVDVVDQP
jgi:predicted small lipoprotein YifL